MTIGALIITKNEAHNIEACINSLRTCADEILVIDSLSEDNTTILAQKHGASVIQIPFLGYGKTKNYGAQQLKSDYILSIDADERLDKTLQNAILHLKKSEELAQAYVFKRLNNYCGQWIKHGGWNPDLKVRLWKKGVGVWDDSEVHEKLLLSSATQPRELEGNLLHYSYHSIESHLKKIELYSTKGSLALLSKGKKGFFFKMLFSPVSRFVRDYFLKMGFLDGKNGFVIASLTAYEVFLKYRKAQKG